MLVEVRKSNSTVLASAGLARASFLHHNKMADTAGRRPDLFLCITGSHPPNITNVRPGDEVLNT